MKKNKLKHIKPIFEELDKSDFEENILKKGLSSPLPRDEDDEQEEYTEYLSEGEEYCPVCDSTHLDQDNVELINEFRYGQGEAEARVECMTCGFEFIRMYALSFNGSESSNGEPIYEGEEVDQKSFYNRH